MRADIDGPHGPFEVFCTHLNWKLDQSHVRQQQVASVCEFIASTAKDRGVPADPLRRLQRRARRRPRSACSPGYAASPAEKLVFFDAWRVGGDAGPGWTWSRLNPFTAADPEPDRRIDYVLVGYPGERGAR